MAIRFYWPTASGPARVIGQLSVLGGVLKITDKLNDLDLDIWHTGSP